MKKLLLIPTLVTTSLAPLVAFTSCSCSPKANTTFIFGEEERETEAIGQVANLLGHCQTSSTEKPVVITEACHFVNLKHRNMETQEIEPYDERKINIKVDVNTPDPDYSYIVTINLTHIAESFPFGEFFFDFVFVWYENGDYHHVFEQKIDNFTVIGVGP